ncbi:PleD family two-component system response regulator [Stappia sp. ES.058]|uniref:response regulator n=1 Tax=Stappia sp. ES.058 TaxID=1881061 RepID=UPI00210F268A|nr:response regulator [Stappia sp. ES.058]
MPNLRVLVAEDNPHRRQILRMLLSVYAIRRIFEAEDGASALELIGTRDPDLLLIDRMMPILDGAELTRIIRRFPEPTCYLPIVAVTAHTQRNRVIAARDFGVTEVMCKPVSARGLYLRIANWVPNHRDFVRTKIYFGPDRERFQSPGFIGIERRGAKRDDGYALDGPGEVDQSRPETNMRDSVVS